MGSSDYQEFGFGDGDENVGGGKFDRFKAREGEKYRISFAWWPMKDGKPDLDAKTPRFVGAKRHYLQGVGYFLAKGPEYDRIAGGAPKDQIATVIVVWPTTRKGELDRQRFAEGDFQVQPWVFGSDKYKQLGTRHEEWHFGSYDLTITCTDTQFQKMDLSPAKENLFRKCMENDKLKSVVDEINVRVAQIIGANDKGEPVGLRGIIARDLTIEKIREKLGGGTSGGGAGPALSADSSAVDSLIDDLVE